VTHGRAYFPRPITSFWHLFQGWKRFQTPALPVPRPHTEVQKAIESGLDAVVAKLEGHERTVDSLRSLFRTLLHQRMTAQIRVHDLDLSALQEAQPAAAE
jgi:hypothetical protein